MKINNSIYKLYYQWWKNIDKSIFYLISLLFFMGLFFSLVSTSLIASDKLDTNSYFFFFKHFIFISIGMSIIFFFSFISSEKLFFFSIILFFIFFISLLLVPIIGIEVKGSKRWIDLFILPRFQPIEILKPFFIVFIATILSNEKNRNVLIKYSLSFIPVLVILFLLMLQPDIGQTLLILFSWLVLIFISGVNLFYIFGFCLLIMFLLSYFIIFVPRFEYVQGRILSFFDRDNGNYNFQSEKSIESIVSGGFLGKGIGEGTLKGKVPEAHTDYIISVISEEFGVITIVLILFLFLIFIYTIFKKTYFENNQKKKIILVGCASLILMQATIHIGVNIRLFPTTGMTLPFLSYGGSSIISISFLSGIILNLTRRRINHKL
ncbi:MAG: cell division protein FtsW [Alphaproteobacteria bacterium]|nr:cell division protein FtsW [Alphaproteobacteria bacterium]